MRPAWGSSGEGYVRPQTSDLLTPLFPLGKTMAVTLRLTRMGAKKKPFYRIVAADKRAPRDGRCIEQLGYYDPMTEPPAIKIDLERVDYWLGVGANPSDTVGQLIEKARTASDIPAED